MMYKFDFKFQAMFAIFGFLSALLIIYLVTRKIDWITPISIAIIDFAAAGFYASYKCKK
ncbi:MAG TPA: hypothetical protein VMC07_01335 [Candidatus Omnitrophota bacterium]|nr:hypothetical protein [Candidatus Omnitrophota bacterium]